MTATGPYDSLRQSALSLLDDGNSVESVARVLDIPDAVLRRWRDAPARHAQPATAPPAQAQAHAPGQPIRFPTTLVFGATSATRLLSLGMAGVIVLVMVPGWYALARSQFDDGPIVKAFLLLFVAVLLCSAVAKLLRTAQTQLILGPDAVIVPHLFGRSVLPYHELADYWLVMHIQRGGEDGEVEIEGRLLTLHARRAGVRPIELFIRDDAVLDPRIVERLDQVKRANQGVQPLTRLRDIPIA